MSPHLTSILAETEELREVGLTLKEKDLVKQMTAVKLLCTKTLLCQGWCDFSALPSTSPALQKKKKKNFFSETSWALLFHAVDAVGQRPSVDYACGWHVHPSEHPLNKNNAIIAKTEICWRFAEGKREAVNKVSESKWAYQT